MRQPEQTVLTNMCMVFDDQGRVLVQERRDPNWCGITFPGGHVEQGESFVDSVIREVREETGLTIHHPVLCGLKQWMEEDGVRYLVIFYKTDQFEGTLASPEEGEVFWMDLKEMKQSNLAPGMEYMLRVFLEDSLSEVYLHFEHGDWKNTLK